MALSPIEYCDFSDLPRDQCTHCTQRTRTLPDTMFQANREPLGPWFPARFPGRCSANPRHAIHEGDQIRSDGEGGYVCSSCGREEG